jgi:cytoskeletal protein RodZ
MKKLLVVVGLSAIAMAGKCSSDKAKEETKTQEEFPVKEESQVPAEEVPSYEQQEAPTSAPVEGTPAPTESTPAPTDTTTPAPTAPAPTGN